MRVLIVEDHADLAEDIADGLRDRRVGADVAYDGAIAMQKALLLRYDVPKVHGDAVCAALAAASTGTRILRLTAAGTVGDRVEGLNLVEQKLG